MVEAVASEVVVDVATGVDANDKQSKAESQYRREPKSNAEESGERWRRPRAG